MSATTNINSTAAYAPMIHTDWVGWPGGSPAGQCCARAKPPNADRIAARHQAVAVMLMSEDFKSGAPNAFLADRQESSSPSTRGQANAVNRLGRGRLSAGSCAYIVAWF